MNFRGTPQYQSYWLCGHCEKGVAMIVYGRNTNSGPMNVTGDAMQSFHFVERWPSVQPLSAPSHTPPSIASRFIEAEDSYKRQKWNSAAGMYRSALDIATKAMEPDWVKKSFYTRLQLMKESGRITTDMWDWATHVRLEGNDALHDPEDFIEGDTKPLRFFTEMFLRYIYELPGEVARLRSDDTKKE
jgi:hypothetical protein